MKFLRNLLHVLFVTANIGVIILFLLSAYSDRISPAKSVLAAYLGLAFPIFFALNVCFIIYWGFTKRWKILIIGLCTFLICGGAISRYFPFNRRANPVPQENVIKVLTYNVMNFAGKKHTKESPNKIIEYINETDADIVCLQEYTVQKSGKDLTSKTVSNALKKYPYQSVIKLNTTRYGLSGLAVFSKFPISNSRKIDYKSLHNGSSIHELDINGKKLILINNHLESFKLTLKDRTQYSSLIKSFDSDILGQIKGTFQSKLGPAFIQRATQAQIIAKEIEKAGGDYILVCGDFNDTPISYAHRIIQGNLTDAFVASGKGMGVTYNQNLFLFRIDNILNSSNITPLNCTVDKVKYSDHYPMWCYLQLN